MTTADFSLPRLLGLGLSAMLIPLGSTMIAVALPSIASDLNRAPATLTQWLVNGYLLVNIVALAPGGWLADRWGHKKTLRLGQAVFAVGCVLPLMSHDFGMLVASRLLMALGGALIIPTVMAVFKVSVPPQMRHRVFGYFGAMMSFSAALGPSLGGVLVQGFGWLAIFFMNLPPLALSVWLSRGFFKAGAASAPAAAATTAQRFDWRGALLMAAMLVCLVVGLKDQPLLLLPAALLLALFIACERRTAQPLMDLRLFADRSFAAGCAIIALQNLAMYALLFQLPFLLKLLYQWGPQQAGPFMTAFMVANMLGAALGGRIAERVGARATCVAGSLLSVAGLLGLSLVDAHVAPLLVAAALAIAGLGLGLAVGPSQGAAMAHVAHSASGIASGVLSTCRYLGGIVGVSILGLLLSSAASSADLARHEQAILIFAASFFVAGLVSLRLPGRVSQA